MKRLVASLVALAFGITLLSAPMVALSVPGNTCNPPAGHGRSGCHRVSSPPPAITPSESSIPASATATALSAPSKVKVKKLLEVSGTVSPGGAAGTVIIIKARLVGSKWKSAGSASVSVVDGSYRYSFRPTKKGKWRIVAKFSGGVVGTTNYAASRSRMKNVKVR